MDHLDFERPEAKPSSLEPVIVSLRRGERVVLQGLAGTGRTWVAERAIADAPQKLHLRFGPSSDRHAQAFAQASIQLASQEPLRAFVDRGVEAGVAAIARLTQGFVVVADDADSIFQSQDESSWLDAVPGMLAPADRLWRQWLSGRTGGTLVVTQRPVGEGFAVLSHRGTGSWPIKLRYAEGGQRDWKRVAEVLGERPDRLFFAASVLPLLSALELDGLLANEEAFLYSLGHAFRQRAGRRARALDVIAALEGAPEALVRAALAHASPRTEAEPLRFLDEQDALFTELRDKHLIAVVAGRVELSLAVREARAAAELPAQSAARLAIALLSRINSTSSLEPDDAAGVLAVHRLALLGGDTNLALKTAKLHVHGLIELARRASQESLYEEAWLQYGRIRQMLEDGPASEQDSMRRVRSYVLHYHAYNGHRSRRLPLDACLADSSKAVELWSENARWHGQRIELLSRLGRIRDAEQALEWAEAAVKDHPQRARHLRVFPAARSLQFGLVRHCLKLLDVETTWRDDPEAVDLHLGILNHLHSGTEVEQLESGKSSLLFHRKMRFQLRRVRGTWIAELPDLPTDAKSPNILEAQDLLVERIASELRLLLSIPTPRLDEHSAVWKSRLLSVVDVLNSEIGLDFREERWLLGYVEDRRFIPVQRSDLPELDLDESISDRERPGLWFGRVAVRRDGQPAGSVLELSPAGSAQSAENLRAALRALREEATS